MMPDSTRAYQICTRCIMDTSDADISFDEKGVCNHCRYFDEVITPKWFPNEEGRKRLLPIVERIKAEGQGKDYDSIIGLSGGADSSYMAFIAKELGLRPLAVHIDGGWNSELAVKNIETIVKKLDIDLFTHVVDWQEMKDVQLAFLKAGVANQDTPQDHAFFAELYRFAIKNGIRYVLNGANWATEGVLARSWGYNAMDLRQLRAIHSQFGQEQLKTFPQVSFFKYYVLFPYLHRMKVVRLLDYVPYNKQEAMQLLKEKFDWRYYGGKHYESRFTKFFQGYYLPVKFGYDKRRAHLSSLILAGQLSRKAALEEMQKAAYPLEELDEDKAFVAKKLGISVATLDQLIEEPNKSFKDYPSNSYLASIARTLSKRFKQISLGKA